MVVVTGILLPWVHACASEASQQTACSSQRLCQQPVNWAGTMKTGSRSGSIHQAYYVCLLPPAICTEAVKPPSLPQASASGCFVCYSHDTISASWNLEGGLSFDPWQAATEKWADFSPCLPLRIMLSGVFSTCLVALMIPCKGGTLVLNIISCAVHIWSDQRFRLVTERRRQITNRKI